MAATVAQFGRHFISLWELSRKTDIAFIIISIINVFMGILSLFLNIFVTFGILLIAITILSLTAAFLTIAYMAFVRKSRQALIFLLSSVPIFISAMIFAMKALAVIPASFFTAHGILLGGAFQIVVLSAGLADKINMMKKNIMRAEVKYRHIVESSADIIFSLNKDLTVLSVNNAVKKHLGYRPEEFVNRNFLDFIQDTWSERTIITRQLVEEEIASLYEKKSSIQFKTTFKPRYGSEPEDFSVKLEYTEQDQAGYTILGKAAPVSDDALLPFLLVEHFVYSMDNYLNNADHMSQRLTRNLTVHMSPSDLSMIRVSIREIIINAIEHGNLGISFEEKTGALESDNYFELLHARQKDPVLNSRKVTIDYSLDEGGVRYMITDEGDGFDYRRILDAAPEDFNGKFLAHGRGLIMAQSAFNTIQFNERGNRITLVKSFTQGGQ
jgi:two-component system, sensor histidine kinase LadS